MIKLIVAINILLVITLTAPTSVFSATDADIDKMTSYAVIIGRAAGCGIDTGDAMRRVGKWMDRRFPRQGTYLVIFMAGVEQHAKQQAEGKSPDTCAQVKRSFRNTPWP